MEVVTDPVVATPQRPAKPVFPILVRAAAILRERGCITYGWGWEGRICTVSAVFLAFEEEGITRKEAEQSREMQVLIDSVRPGWKYWNAITAWHDCPDVTEADVLERLERVAWFGQ